MNRLSCKANFPSNGLSTYVNISSTSVMKRQAIERLNIASFLLQLLPPPSEIVRAFCTYHCYIFPSYGVSLSGILFREENCFCLVISRRPSSYRWWPALPPDPTGEGGHRDWDALVAVYHSIAYATPPPCCSSSLWWGRRKTSLLGIYCQSMFLQILEETIKMTSLIIGQLKLVTSSNYCLIPISEMGRWQ